MFWLTSWFAGCVEITGTAVDAEKINQTAMWFEELALAARETFPTSAAIDSKQGFLFVTETVNARVLLQLGGSLAYWSSALVLVTESAVTSCNRRQSKWQNPDFRLQRQALRAFGSNGSGSGQLSSPFGLVPLEELGLGLKFCGRNFVPTSLPLPESEFTRDYVENFCSIRTNTHTSSQLRHNTHRSDERQANARRHCASY